MTGVTSSSTVSTVALIISSFPFGPTRWNYGSAQLWKYVPTID